MFYMGMAVQDCNPSVTLGRLSQVDCLKFKVDLGYLVSSRAAA